MPCSTATLRAIRSLRLLAAMACLTGVAHAAVGSIAPAQACNYLTGTGLPTTTWRQQSDGGYRCSSPHIDIGTVPGKSGRLNGIVYSASGGAQSVTALQLTIDVDNPDQAAPVHRRLKDIAIALARKLGIELPAALQEAIAGGTNAKIVAGSYTTSVQRSDRAAGAYEIRVVFE